MPQRPLPPDPLYYGRTLDPVDNRIMQLLCEGHSHREVAQMVGMRINSMSTRLYHIRSKLNARTTIEAAVIWRQGYTPDTGLRRLLMDRAEGRADDCE